MENFKFIIFFILSFCISQAQRIPVEYFQKISISSSAIIELKNLENKKNKSNYDILRIGELYAMNRQANIKANIKDLIVYNFSSDCWNTQEQSMQL